MPFQAEGERGLFGRHLRAQGLKVTPGVGVEQDFRHGVVPPLPLTSLCSEIFSSFFLSMSFSKCIFSVFSMESSFRSSALMARIFSLQPSFTVTSFAFSGSRARIFSL